MTQFNKKDSVADSVASDMIDIMESAEYQAVFSKTAAVKKDDKKDKKDKKDDKKKDKAELFKKKFSKKKKKEAELKSVVECLSKISEVLDTHGLVKSAMSALNGIELVVAEAQLIAEAKKKHKKDKDEDDEDEDEDDECDEDDDNDCGDEHEEHHHHPEVVVLELKDHGDADLGHAEDGIDGMGEELRALLSELGLGGEDEKKKTDVDDAMMVSASKELDEDFDEDYSDVYSLPKEAGYRDEIVKVAAKKAKPKGEFVFPANSSKVKDKKDHYPLNTEGRGRNALAQVHKYKKVPPWYKGSLEELINAVTRAVKRKYKGIEVSKK